MIKPEELRIGNYVCVGNPANIFVTCKDGDLKKDVDIVNEISSYVVDIFNGGSYGSASYFAPVDPKNINPIPITVE